MTLDTTMGQSFSALQSNRFGSNCPFYHNGCSNCSYEGKRDSRCRTFDYLNMKFVQVTAAAERLSMADEQEYELELARIVSGNSSNH